MADLTVELHSSFPDADAVIAAVATSAVKFLPGVTAAGVVRVGKDGVLACQGATNPQALQMVQAEHRIGYGPCLHVLEPGNLPKMMLDGLAGDRRWPEYATEALSIGIGAVLAVRLEAGQALLLLTDSVFDGSVVDGVEVFAAHAAVAATQARIHSELLDAVQSRTSSGRPKAF